MENISPNISYIEATRSNIALKYELLNSPHPKALLAMKLLANKVFEPLRKWYGKPITVTSFYRSPKVEARAGRTGKSQHCKGEAIDIDTANYNSELFKYIRQNLDFDQLIWEYGDDKSPAWIHVSYKADGNRRQILRATRDKAGKTSYFDFDRYYNRVKPNK